MFVQSTSLSLSHQLSAPSLSLSVALLFSSHLPALRERDRANAARSPGPKEGGTRRGGAIGGGNGDYAASSERQRACCNQHCRRSSSSPSTCWARPRHKQPLVAHQEAEEATQTVRRPPSFAARERKRERKGEKRLRFSSCGKRSLVFSLLFFNLHIFPPPHLFSPLPNPNPPPSPPKKMETEDKKSTSSNGLRKIDVEE